MEHLKEKIKSLPMHPGVYLMKDKKGEIIYVGKAKHLKNRVSSYFVSNKGHNFKTNVLVSHIVDFDIIITKSEFDALVLENSLIKKYKPKYNILLKDDKGYPYIKITYKDLYPDFFIVNKPSSDGNKYLGPYSSRSVAKTAIDTIKQVLKIKDCSRKFPRDIGRERPCLNAHIGRCSAPCARKITQAEYYETIKQAEVLLRGNFKGLIEDLTAKMMALSEDLEFEQASVIRDRIRAVTKLMEKQTVVASGFSELDVVAFAKGYTKCAIVVFHYKTGSLIEKEFTILDGEFDENEALSSFIKQYYSLRNNTPKEIALSHEIEDIDAVEEFLCSISKTKLSIPIKGIRREFVRLAILNGQEEITRVETTSERTNKTLELLANTLGVSKKINRIEAYDISNISGTNTVGSMVVFENGVKKPSEYRKFKINSVIDTQDDYTSMSEMIIRRLENYVNGHSNFSKLPELIILDGGLGHVNTLKPIIDSYNLDILVVGAVKDNRHRTRGLIFSDGREVSLETIPTLFTLVGNMQEEVHRFAITYHKSLRNKALKASSLDNIVGVGDERKRALLRKFKTISAIKNATIEELMQVVPQNVAENIFRFYAK
ncbi:MAG: excinuclease ABC subunit UvrC [Clostridia bacterium]